MKKWVMNIFVRAAELCCGFTCVAHLYSCAGSNNKSDYSNNFFRKIIKVLPVLFILSSSVFATDKVFDFSITCQQAYTQINSLKLSNGQQLINQAIKENPDNLIPELLESYIDFYILFFNEDPAEYDKRIDNFSDRIDKLDDGPESSPYYNFCKSAIYMQKACVEIKFGRQWSAGWTFRKAFSLIKENKSDYPDFILNDMIYGPMQVAAGTIPSGYKWLAGLLGIKGSIKNGVALMDKFINSNDAMARLFFNEASFYYCYIMFYIENKPDAVFDFINQRKLDIVNNHQLAYMAANLAINDKRTDYAKSVIENRNISPEYFDIPVWNFEMAYVQLHHLELQDAVKYFSAFTKQFKGNFYLKDANEKLSWCYYLLGDQKNAEAMRQLVILKGNQLTDADKQAYKDAKNGIWPNTLLLKARLLNDGGYNKEALDLLVGKSASNFDKPDEKLEFAYRVARIYDDTKRDSEAVKMYLLAIDLGKNRTEYFAARAALQIGWIYEQQGKKDLAKQYYQQCIDMKDHDYKDSLDQKAKAGIARCEGN